MPGGPPSHQLPQASDPYHHMMVPPMQQPPQHPPQQPQQQPQQHMAPGYAPPHFQQQQPLQQQGSLQGGCIGGHEGQTTLLWCGGKAAQQQVKPAVLPLFATCQRCMTLT